MNMLLTFASRLVAAARLPFRIAAHRRVLATLGAFDDRELADIGLSRQDLRDATALPRAADPTDLLAERARRRADPSGRRLAAE